MQGSVEKESMSPWGKEVYWDMRYNKKKDTSWKRHRKTQRRS